MDTDNSSKNIDSSNVHPFETPHTLLPRSAWNSPLTKLRLTLKVKQLLDQQENSTDMP